MDISLESDIYEPNICENGNYTDYVPPSSKFKNGLRCPCGARKDHVFDTRTSFIGHIKTKTHQKCAYSWSFFFFWRKLQE